MTGLPNQTKGIFLAGIKRGWGSFIWISQIIIPVSFLVALLQWAGWLNQLDFLLDPLMRLLNLPPEAALPIISGMVINLYAGIAVMYTIPFTIGQMTLIAVFNLIAHNLIAEGIIQHKSGLNVIKTTLIRITAATIVLLIVSRFLGDTSQSISTPGGLAVQAPILEVLKNWGIDTLQLLLRILGIVMTIMVLLEFSETLNWNKYSRRFLRPLMKILRLSDRTATLWLTSVTFGLMYGGAVIIDEAKKGTLTREELERLHISVGINHSMIEDSALFLVMGLHPFWLWVPKLVMAIAAVQIYRVIRFLNIRLFQAKAKTREEGPRPS